MNSGEFEHHLRTIANDDRDFLYPNWIASAQYFERLARSGESIFPALDPLLRIFYETHQVPVMQPAIRAVMIELLRENRTHEIENTFLHDDFKTWVIEALADLARSFDIGPAMPSIVLHFEASPFRAAEAIAMQIRKKRATVAQVCDLMMTEEFSRKSLVRVLATTASSGIDITEHVSSYARLLTYQDSQKLAIQELPWFTGESKANIAIVEELGRIANDPNAESDVRERAAYFLADHYSTTDAEKFSSLLENESSFVRAGTALYLAHTIPKSRGTRRAEWIDKLTLYLLDQDSYVRSVALRQIDSMIQSGNKFEPSLDAIAKLAQAAKKQEDLIPFLLHFASESKSLKSVIEKSLASPQSENAALILKALREPTVRRCSICSSLNRVESWNHELRTPAQIKKMRESGNLRFCTECENIYQFSYSSEVEDNHTSESFELERLHPAAALKMLQGEDAIQYKEQLPRLLQSLRSETSHVDEWIRSEAAWKLAEYLLSTEQWTEIDTLSLQNQTCLKEITLAVASAVRSGVDAGHTLTTIRRAMQAEHCETRMNSAFVLSCMSLQGESNELPEILYSTDSCVLQGCLQALFAHASRDLPCPHLDRIAALTLHDDDRVRAFANYVVERAKENGQKIPFLVPNLMKALRSKNARMKQDGMRFLRSEITQQNAAQILGEAVSLLKDSERYGLVELIEACAEAGASLERYTGQFISDLQDSRGDLLRLLTVAARQNPSMIGRNATDAIAECLNDSRLLPAASHLFEFLSNSKCDLTTAMPAIQSFIDRAVSTDSYTESLIQVLIRSLAGLSDYESIMKLLSHRTTTIRLSVLYRIKDLASEGLQFRAILEPLQSLLKDPSAGVREMAEKVITQVSQS